MRIDMHCHVLGNGKLIENDLIRMEGDLNQDGMISTFEYFEILYRFLSQQVKVLNKRLQQDQAAHKRFFFGASVSPNRSDWESELDFIIHETEAVLIKWIPSVQHIRVESPAHHRFYRALADAKIPLLCHVGPKYAFAAGIRNHHLGRHLRIEPVHAPSLSA